MRGKRRIDPDQSRQLEEALRRGIDWKDFGAIMAQILVDSPGDLRIFLGGFLDRAAEMSYMSQRLLNAQVYFLEISLEGGGPARKIILANFGKDSSTSDEEAIAWGRRLRYAPATFGDILAVYRQHPDLHRSLGRKVVIVTIPKFNGLKHPHEKTGVCFYDGGQKEKPVTIDSVNRSNDSVWFAFVEEDELAETESKG